MAKEIPLIQPIGQEKREPMIPMPPKEEKHETAEVGIIRGLDVKDYLTEIFLRLNGWDYDIINEVWFCPENPTPIMNELGIKNFMETLHAVGSKVTTMSNFDQNEINIRVEKFVKRNLAHFIAWADTFNLKEENFNVIENYLFTMADGAYRKARGAGDRNTVRGIYSENVLARMYSPGQSPQQEPAKKKGIFSWIPGFK